MNKIKKFDRIEFDSLFFFQASGGRKYHIYDTDIFVKLSAVCARTKSSKERNSLLFIIPRDNDSTDCQNSMSPFMRHLQ